MAGSIPVRQTREGAAVVKVTGFALPPLGRGMLLRPPTASAGTAPAAPASSPAAPSAPTSTRSAPAAASGTACATTPSAPPARSSWSARSASTSTAATPASRSPHADVGNEALLVSRARSRGESAPARTSAPSSLKRDETYPHRPVTYAQQQIQWLTSKRRRGVEFWEGFLVADRGAAVLVVVALLPHMSRARRNHSR
jgi:hypothetical protein